MTAGKDDQMFLKSFKKDFYDAIKKVKQEESADFTETIFENLRTSDSENF